ncbi:hypothetical protein PoB_006697900 [Plakobranchus ocellatus]|uniref:Uncharacterized protein n=1 Tax=Plakobranchus ocellatus TaxID=259542 RepID=A0AAV4D8F7_9GAST|nr:hypothetical protein PoB_006697900 [Plakobranchus ocellatus]
MRSFDCELNAVADLSKELTRRHLGASPLPGLVISVCRALVQALEGSGRADEGETPRNTYGGWVYGRDCTLTSVAALRCRHYRNEIAIKTTNSFQYKGSFAI